jgi:hypothetical protein
MNVTEADARDYLLFFCRREVESSIMMEGRTGPLDPSMERPTDAAVSKFVRELLPHFTNVVNQVRESLCAGQNMCVVNGEQNLEKKYSTAIMNIFRAVFGIQCSDERMMRWSPSSRAMVGVKVGFEKMVEERRRKLSEEKMAEENEVAAYQKAMEEYRKKREEASQKALLPIKPPAAAPAPAEKAQAPIVVSEEQVGTLLDAVAEIRRDLDGLLKTQALLVSEGADVSFVQKDIDELKRKRAITIAALDEAVNPTPGKRRRM